jgi:hypothetical protein
MLRYPYVKCEQGSRPCARSQQEMWVRVQIPNHPSGENTRRRQKLFMLLMCAVSSVPLSTPIHQTLHNENDSWTKRFKCTSDTPQRERLLNEALQMHIRHSTTRTTLERSASNAHQTLHNENDSWTTLERSASNAHQTLHNENDSWTKRFKRTSDTPQRERLLNDSWTKRFKCTSDTPCNKVTSIEYRIYIIFDI